MENSFQARCVADVGAILGEGPVWVERDQAIYWVDIKGFRIFRLDGAGAVQSWETPFRVASIVPRDAGGFIAGTDRGFAEIDLTAMRYNAFDQPEPDRATNRFNDGKLDRSGRFWAGTMDDLEQHASGALYRLDPDRSSCRLDDGYRITNGPAFDRAGRRMYHNDTARQLTYAFDLAADGTPGERRTFMQHDPDGGYPDGMTVDSQDCLWIAFWGGWCVRRFSPEGALLATFELPVQQPTSCAFGGAGLDRLYVTSASIGLDAAARVAQPCAGGLFMLDTGVRGIADTPFPG